MAWRCLISFVYCTCCCFLQHLQGWYGKFNIQTPRPSKKKKVSIYFSIPLWRIFFNLIKLSLRKKHKPEGNSLRNSFLKYMPRVTFPMKIIYRNRCLFPYQESQKLQNQKAFSYEEKKPSQKSLGIVWILHCFKKKIRKYRSNVQVFATLYVRQRG